MCAFGIPLCPSKTATKDLRRVLETSSVGCHSQDQNEHRRNGGDHQSSRQGTIYFIHPAN